MSDKKLLPFNPKRVVSKIVKNALDSSGTFAFTEHIEFNVGRIVCERIYYYYDGTEGDLSVVKSDLFNNNDKSNNSSALISKLDELIKETRSLRSDITKLQIKVEMDGEKVGKGVIQNSYIAG
jgi:hypothetical protein